MEVSVRQGDTFYYYSTLFSVPLQLIIDSNRQITPEKMIVGSIVSIPGYELRSYIIGAGDTFWTIAQQKHIPIDQLILVNNRVNPNALSIGEQIYIPIRVTEKMVYNETPYSSTLLEKQIEQLVKTYPFIQKNIIGTSVMGKPLIELRIGNGEKRIHYNGSFHANEWITTPVLMEFVNEYALALTNGTLIRTLSMYPYYDQVTLSVVPMVNPDGVDLVVEGVPKEEPFHTNVLEINGGSTDFSAWKANIRGVDLNNQFPAEWEIEASRKPTSPSPRDFPGYAPLTEPEAIAMAELTTKEDFAYVLAFHTQGEVIFWDFLQLAPPYAETIVQQFQSVSGYEPIQFVDSYAGFKDWFIQYWQRPGFTVELGRGTNPLPLTQYDRIYDHALGIMLAGLYM